MKPRIGIASAFAIISFSVSARAHHEALFGPQSSLAVESQGFFSLQTHMHAYGANGTETTETTTIVSGGLQLFPDMPLGIAVVQPFTYETTREPTPLGSVGPFSACDGCFRMENTLVASQYRFDFSSLQRAWEKDGNFALVSGALELPIGNKDYPPTRGPYNFILAGMVGLEKGAWSSVLLSYYRRNTPDFSSSKKGDNTLAALGVAFTPIDDPDRMLSFQVGGGWEYHLRDWVAGSEIEASGGSQFLVSPTIVGSFAKNLRVFVLVTLPVAQTMRGDDEVDRWRAGAGLIYSFDREPEPPVVAPPPSE